MHFSAGGNSADKRVLFSTLCASSSFCRAQIPGLYTSGWVARGPVGVIASTRIDANSVVDQLLHDWQASKGTSRLSDAPSGTSGAAVQEGAPAAVENASSAAAGTHRITSWDDWLCLDAEEVRRGQALGKLREKIVCTYTFSKGANVAHENVEEADSRRPRHPPQLLTRCSALLADRPRQMRIHIPLRRLGLH